MVTQRANSISVCKTDRTTHFAITQVPVVNNLATYCNLATDYLQHTENIPTKSVH